jgi:hypothetical protein
MKNNIDSLLNHYILCVHFAFSKAKKKVLTEKQSCILVEYFTRNVVIRRDLRKIRLLFIRKQKYDAKLISR